MKKLCSVLLSAMLLLSLAVAGSAVFAANDGVEELVSEEAVQEDPVVEETTQKSMSSQIKIILCIAGVIGLLSGAYAAFTVINMKTKAPELEEAEGRRRKVQAVDDGEEAVHHSATYLNAHAQKEPQVAAPQEEDWERTPAPAQKKDEPDWMNASVDEIMADLEKEVQLNEDNEVERKPLYEEYK
jgi:flagellar basal body-associated protein FliL